MAKKTDKTSPSGSNPEDSEKSRDEPETEEDEPNFSDPEDYVEDVDEEGKSAAFRYWYML